ncbi:MAG TPA: GNAT family N-acetyltransferase, partial [Anaerolineales bacterium]|nr:GNAT family N-acetyltransferase [Anaerolineales bacterium]
WDGEFTHFRRLYADVYAATQTGKALMWIAELPDPGLIGQLFVQLNSGRRDLADGAQRAYIYGFRIKPAYRGCGLGSRMLRIAEADLAQRGFNLITLNVARDNPDARRLYEQRGYSVRSAEPGRWFYYDEKGARVEVHEPAWRMEKRLA